MKKDMKIDITSLSYEKLNSRLLALGFKSYSASQVSDWLYKKNVYDFETMTNIKKELRNVLEDKFYIPNPKIIKVLKSRDGTIKFSFELEDQNTIETVFIRLEKRNTLCISTQIGCRLACKFCLTGRINFKRNLSTSEIVNQIRSVKKYFLENLDDKKISNIVFMGMGEPLLNFDNLLNAIDIITNDKCMSFSKRRVTVSTAGIIPEIIKLGEKTDVNLAVSLNAADNKTRSRLMPINKKYSIEKLIDTLKAYPLAKRKRITFEYVLLDNINDSISDAKNLVRILQGIPSKINLIPYNEHKLLPYRASREEKIEDFYQYLYKKNNVVKRKARGVDISAGCGQLGHIE